MHQGCLGLFIKMVWVVTNLPKFGLSQVQSHTQEGERFFGGGGTRLLIFHLKKKNSDTELIANTTIITFTNVTVLITLRNNPNNLYTPNNFNYPNHLVIH